MRIIIILICMVFCSVSYAMEAEIKEIRNLHNGILIIEVEFKEGDLIVGQKEYTIADSPEAIHSFKTKQIQNDILYMEETLQEQDIDIEVGDVIKKRSK